MGAGRSPTHPPFSSMAAPDIRLDWETYIPEEKADRLLELLVFYGPPFPLRDQDGNEIVYPETPEASLPGSPCPSNVSVSSHTVPSLVSELGDGGEYRAWRGVAQVHRAQVSHRVSLATGQPQWWHQG